MRWTVEAFFLVRYGQIIDLFLDISPPIKKPQDCPLWVTRDICVQQQFHVTPWIYLLLVNPDATSWCNVLSKNASDQMKYVAIWMIRHSWHTDLGARNIDLCQIVPIVKFGKSTVILGHFQWLRDKWPIDSPINISWKSRLKLCFPVRKLLENHNFQ